MNKRYTFEGEEGKVLTVTGSVKPYPIVWQSCTGTISTFTSDGRHCISEPVSLIEVKQTHWINVYPNHVGGPYSSRVTADAADMYAGVTRIACIEFKDGDGI